MKDTPYSNYRLTVRLELQNKPGVFAAVATRLAEEQANLGAVDIVDATSDKMIRDVTFDCKNEEHSQVVLKRLQDLPNVQVVSYSDPIFLLHLGGKIRVQSKVPLQTRNQLSMAYTPGVAKVCYAIANDPAKVHTLTVKHNSVAVVSDGSAILGLGNLGAEAAIPVMEGKAMLFKEFAGIDAWPICLSTQDTEEIIATVQRIAPVFGGINLEDISYPRCFEIEKRLKETLDIPVMHDDQWGTAVVTLAALKNALKLVNKDISKIKVVMSGIGAAGVACSSILISAGVRHLQACSRHGVVLSASPETLYENRHQLMTLVDRDHPKQPLKEALVGADVFVGVSAANLLTPADIKKMAKDPIVFAMANPDPEINPLDGIKVCRVFGSGRSDFPNQINNALAFPGIFKGALSVRAKQINEEMTLAAAEAIANLITTDQLTEEYIVPSIFDRRVVDAVSSAVAQAAIQSGVARKKTTDKEQALTL